MTEFTMSRHALSRAIDMAVDGDEIRDAVLKPRDSFYSPRTMTRWLTRGRITVCVTSDEVPTVTTILWARASGWVADSEFPPIEGRNSHDLSGGRRMEKMRRKARDR